MLVDDGYSHHLHRLNRKVGKGGHRLMRKERWKMLPNLVRLLLVGRSGVYLDSVIRASRGMPPFGAGAGLTLRRLGVYEGGEIKLERIVDRRDR